MSHVLHVFGSVDAAMAWGHPTLLHPGVIAEAKSPGHTRYVLPGAIISTLVLSSSADMRKIFGLRFTAIFVDESLPRLYAGDLGELMSLLRSRVQW